MKLTRNRLRKLISEVYRDTQRSSRARYRNPSKAYAEELAGMLGANLDSRPLVANQYRMFSVHGEGTKIEIGLPGTVSWPYGASVIIENPAGGRNPSLQFPISGIPEIDAKFIGRLISMPLEDFINLSDATLGYPQPSKSGPGFVRTQPKMKSSEWLEIIMPGYPRRFLQ